MEALEFLKEAQRMCRSEECFLHCPVHDVCFLDNYDAVSEDDIKTFVSSVEVWSKKNPPKTNAQKFEEVFGLSGHRLIDQRAQWWDEPYKEPEHED